MFRRTANRLWSHRKQQAHEVGMTDAGNDRWSEQAKALSLLMTTWPSVTGSEGEAAFAGRLRALLAETPYFQANPDQLFTRPSHGEPKRDNLLALVRGKGRHTLVLAGHFDTVSIANYGTLASLATEPNLLLPALIEELSSRPTLGSAEAKALADLRSGNFLPGRGLLDMKSGLAAGIVALERFAELDEPPGNLLFVATPDEENRSRGMISLRNALPGIARDFGLDIIGGINLDSTSDEGDGADGRALYLGSVGKYSPFAFVVGCPTHAGYAFHGVSAHLIAAEIMRAMEFNDELTDEAFGETSPAPVCLEGRDVRHGYEVTTPAHVWLSFNWLTHRKSAVEMLAGFKAIVHQALEAALDTQRRNATRYFRPQGKQPPFSYQGRVLTYNDLRDLVRERGGEPALAKLAEREASLAGENDQLAISRELVALAVNEAGLEGPAVVVGFSSLHYPMVHINQTGARGRVFHERLTQAIATIEVRHRTRIATKQFFAGISDMSFFGHRPVAANASVLIENTPASALSDDPPDGLLSYPVVNIGPWGRDYHQKWERVHAPYTFEILPDLIYEAALRCLKD
jgi:arginine utilization protein RocB